MAKSILEIKPEEIIMVYSGKPGCGCGCRGFYRVNPMFLERATKDRGYSYRPEEINFTTVKKVLKEMQKREAEVVVDDKMQHETIYSLEDETRYRWVYVAK